MLKLLGRLAVFLLPIGAGLGWIEWRLSLPPDDRSSPRIVITGTSYEMRGIDPRQLPCGGINLASNSQPLNRSAALATLYATRIRTIQAFVIGLSPFSLDLPQEADEFVLSRRISKVFGWRNGLSLAQYQPRDSLRTAFRGGVWNVPDRGWSACGDATWDSAGGAAADRARLRLRMTATSNREANLASIRSEIATARAVGATPVMVVSPVSPAYRRVMPWGLSEQFRDAVELLSNKEQVAVADYMSDPRFVDADFCDPDHLSRDGALKFSRILAAEVLAPILHCNPTTTRWMGP